ncbi:MAG: DUF4412 domain-containing protein [Thermodesulfobacteriota bacterium]
MKGKTLFFSIVLVGMLLSEAPGEGLAGVVVEQVVRDRDGIPSRASLYYSDYRFRTDHLESGMTTILDFKGDGLTMIDHRSKSYVEVKLSQWEREVAKRLKKEFTGIKPKERKITVRKTGRTAVINGFQTEQIEILADDELIEENWVTHDVEMKEIEKVMDRVAQGFSKDFRVEMKEGREIYEKLKPYGFSILTKDHAITHGLRAIDRVEVKKIEKKELKDDVFLPPAGYQKIVPEPSKK